MKEVRKKENKKKSPSTKYVSTPNNLPVCPLAPRPFFNSPLMLSFKLPCQAILPKRPLVTNQVVLAGV